MQGGRISAKARSARWTRKAAATRDRELVRDGVLSGYVLGSYSASAWDDQTPATPAAFTTSSSPARTERWIAAQFLMRLTRGSW